MVALADIAMTASEVNPVLRAMPHRGWESGCLYHQETVEHPQLCFDHFFKTGTPIKLAHQSPQGPQQDEHRILMARPAAARAERRPRRRAGRGLCFSGHGSAVRLATDRFDPDLTPG